MLTSRISVSVSMRLNKTVMELKPGQQHDHAPRFIVTNSRVSAVISEMNDLSPTDCRVTAVYT